MDQIITAIFSNLVTEGIKSKIKNIRRKNRISKKILTYEDLIQNQLPIIEDKEEIVESYAIVVSRRLKELFSLMSYGSNNDKFWFFLK